MKPIFDPLPNPKSVVLAGQARFTVLTSRLLRMEYSPSGQFEDHPSQAFWCRNLPPPSFTSRQEGAAHIIETEHLRLRYRPGRRGFTASGLSVLVKATGHTWHYGDTPWSGQNLWGTYRTLDAAGGKVELEPGLMARSGGAAVDDAHSLVFDAQGWLQPRQNPANMDLYFFGYGHDYPACLADYTRLAGSVPLVPRWILGNWWSRYWAYRDRELLALMEDFKAHAVPLSVCIVDMDWHITSTGNASNGWTGYTWNKELFPDPPGFIAALHRLGLKTALNLHPAAGVWPHEAAYPEFARHMGLPAQDDLPPAEREAIPFDCADPHFMQAYFELLHHPLEPGALPAEQAVDFWWLDWQQGTKSDLPGLDPLWWLNHLHFYDYARHGQQRPFIFSRWGGLGNHRYPIGFSGDTVVGWDALDNQPSFTATAANVGYGWWSHDIGGHMGGIEEDELYARWMQYGVFSPILRMHCTNNPYHERRPWGRGPDAERAASAALRLRHALIPYIYSMAWREHTTAMPLITPLYYTHPEQPEAYECGQEYWFGSQLLAAPFTRPAHPETGLSRQPVWLPAGEWFHFFSGEALQGGGWRDVYGTLDDIPVYARAGAIVPLAEAEGWADTGNPAGLHVYIFPGANGHFELYEDDGVSNAYLDGQSALTPMTLEWSGEALKLQIGPVQGEASLIPAQRAYHLHVRGVQPPEVVEVCINGLSHPAHSHFDPSTDTFDLTDLPLAPGDALTLVLSGPGLQARRSRKLETLRKYLRAFRLDSWYKLGIEQAWPKIAAGEMDPRQARPLTEVQRLALESLLK